METTDYISLYGTVPDSIVDGPSLRYAVFVQGCSHHCPGCHNPESQPAEGGMLTRLSDLLADIEANGLVHDVTLSGGEPFEQPEACAALAAELKRRGYGIWCYTGYLYEGLEKRAAEAEEAAREACAAEAAKGCPEEAESPKSDEEGTGRVFTTASTPGTAAFGLSPALARDLAVGRLLDNIDVLVDGPFVEARKSLELKWCGSSNQRLIDVPATRRAGHIVEWKPATFNLERPANW